MALECGFKSRPRNQNYSEVCSLAKEKPIAEIRNGAVYVLQAGTPIYVKTAQMSAIIGKSNQWVGQLVSQGTMFKKQTPHGAMFELTESMRSYCEMLEARNDEKDDDDEKTEKSRRKAEALLKASKAKIASMDAEERMGKMHRSEDVAAMTEDLIYAIRSALVALPGRLAVEVVDAADSAEAADIIRKEVYHVMDELSNYQYDSAKYQERVRERLRLEAVTGDEEE